MMRGMAAKPGQTAPGPTSLTVAANLAAYRALRGLSLKVMSTALTERGVAMALATYRDVETGKTRATVDLLTAAADVLGVSPTALLMPPAVLPDDPAVLTGVSSGEGESAITAWAMWWWLRGDRPVHPSIPSPDETTRFRLGSWPRFVVPPEPRFDERDNDGTGELA